MLSGFPDGGRGGDSGVGRWLRSRRMRPATLAQVTSMLADAATRAVTAEVDSLYSERPRLAIPWRSTGDVPLRGEVRSLHEVHSRTASGRLVVLGEPGAGKTMAAYEYAVHVLAGRDTYAAIPVVLRIAEWDGAFRNLADWIVDRVAAAHPHLRHWRVGRVEAVRALVDAGLVVPVLDGFDEASQDDRAGLLGLINGFRFPLVVTSRSEEFLTALRGDRLDAEIVELEPLTADAVGDYVEALLNPRSYRWSAIREEVTHNPDGQVARLLRSPLGVDLVLKSYFRDEADRPPRLDEFADPDLVDVLTDAALDGALRSTGRDTVRLLGRLAHHLDRTGVEDIAWWRFHLAVSTRVSHVAALVTGLVGGIGAGLLVGGRGGLLAGAGVGLLVTIGLMFVPWASAESITPPVRRGRRSWRVLSALQVVVLIFGVVSTSTAWVVGVVLVILVVFCVRISRAADAPHGPSVSLRRDRAVALGRGALAGTAALAVLDWSGASPGDPAVWLVVTAVGTVGLSTAAYYRYTLARLVLWSEGMSPWSPLALLGSAHEVGLLRVVGDGYQFRHAVMRGRLAIRYSQQESLPLGQGAERILALRETLLDAAFERADVAAAVDSTTVPRLRSEVGVLFEGAVKSMTIATAGTRERFDASKERYARRVKVSPLWESTFQLKRFGATLVATAVWSYLLVAKVLPEPVVQSSALAGGGVLGLLGMIALGRDVLADSRNTVDRTPGPLVRLAAVPARFVRRHNRLRQGARTIGIHSGVGGLLCVATEELLPASDFVLVPMTTAVAGVALTAIWFAARPLRDRAIALGYDDPARWPAEHDVQRAAAARADAERAYAEWFQALVEHGVLPLVASRVEVLVQRSYGIGLPEASVEKLGDITESTQFVPTDTSARLARMLATMTGGAIGVSGARGVGKSTLLGMFGDRRFSAARDDLTLMVSAPTDYDSRDFLVHLFARVCESVLPEGQMVLSGRTVARRGLVALSVMALGGLLAVAGFRWMMVVDMTGWLRRNTGDVAGWSGVAIMGLPPVWWIWSRVRRRRHTRTMDGTVEDTARRHLTALRYVETTTHTKTASVKPPFGVDLGGSRSRQQATLARTHPELVGEFREFLDFLSLRQRSRTDARIVVCIDELDKIGSAEETERFINDIKSVFGVEGCFFLVAVSEDALASFAQRAFTVRTTFDSAFDAVIRVDRFTLADTRRLLVHRVLRLPEPFVWLCHALSGGLPRDLNRTVRQMYDIRAAHHVHTLPEIAAELIAQDLATAVDAQILHLRGRVDAPATDLQRWVARAVRVPLTSEALLSHRATAPQGQTGDDGLTLIRDQFTAYLYYAATLVRAFQENVDITIEQLGGVDDKTAAMGELAEARAWLSVDPTLSVEHVDAFHDAVPVFRSRTVA